MDDEYEEVLSVELSEVVVLSLLELPDEENTCWIYIITRGF